MQAKKICVIFLRQGLSLEFFLSLPFTEEYGLFNQCVKYIKRGGSAEGKIVLKRTRNDWNFWWKQI